MSILDTYPYSLSAHFLKPSLNIVANSEFKNVSTHNGKGKKISIILNNYLDKSEGECKETDNSTLDHLCSVEINIHM